MWAKLKLILSNLEETILPRVEFSNQVLMKLFILKCKNKNFGYALILASLILLGVKKLKFPPANTFLL